MTTLWIACFAVGVVGFALTAHRVEWSLPRFVFLAFAGVGLWGPDTASQHCIRAAIAADSERWLQALTDVGSSGVYERHGEQLKRAPRGYDPSDPLTDELRYKEWLLVAKLTQKEITAPDFPTLLAELFGITTPVMQFLCEALDQPY